MNRFPARWESLVPERPRRSRRRVLFISLPAVIVAGVLVVTSVPALGLEGQVNVTMARVRGANAGLVKLRQQAEQARKKLTAATEQYRQSKQHLEGTRERLHRMRRDLKDTKARLDELREPVAAIANSAYQHSPVDSFGTVFGSGDPRATMRAAVDFAKLNRENKAMLRDMTELVGRKRRLVKTSKNLIEAAHNRSTQLKEQRKQLEARSEQQTQQLISAMRDIGLDVSRGERLPLGCHPGQVSLGGYPNGLIPTSMLCPLPQDSEYLRADAAVAFGKLNAAYADHFGKPICITDSYRSLAVQQDLYGRKPGLAAIPGTSNHGLGLALDLCDGINVFGSTEFLWMKHHASDYGFVHPDWAAASGSRPEPWHWEYYKADH